ncbi:autotransporter-associated N-terminal domain-containing protein [Fusobacterium pseudoperiodonticum]|uniref:autotransporter-associated N-terminal domain-containing protein n=1 Tax=Fusobacterium pseudoperiodonticum TaxID=2663009 RepID=UPI0028EEDB02|nr:autotransporter-associated N-terminal domain-containing protein [Fusobacterium pseudoperiodonticum]
MRKNNLYDVEKNLRSIAKRYENVKYSVGLAVLFLMKGTNAFSDNNIMQEAEKQKEAITSDQAAKSTAKKQEEKTQKAKQGLKASWTNMQFGANDLYSNFFVAPKTKVEKTSVVKSEKTVLVASADNATTLPMLAKLSSDIETTDAPTMEEIKTSKENLRGSVGNLKDKIDVARRENNKEINGLRLELIQLMEQGNQVVKSPWASWQFGANYFYDNWGSSYKGRGDKSEKYAYEGVLERDTNLFNRYVPVSSKNYSSLAKSSNPRSAASNQREGLRSYGLASTRLAEEPKVVTQVNAGINPKTISKQALNITAKTANAVTLPETVSFSPISPETPVIAPPNVVIKDVTLSPLWNADVPVDTQYMYNTTTKVIKPGFTYKLSEAYHTGIANYDRIKTFSANEVLKTSDGIDYTTVPGYTARGGMRDYTYGAIFEFIGGEYTIEGLTLEVDTVRERNGNIIKGVRAISTDGNGNLKVHNKSNIKLSADNVVGFATDEDPNGAGNLRQMINETDGLIYSTGKGNVAFILVKEQDNPAATHEHINNGKIIMDGDESYAFAFSKTNGVHSNIYITHNINNGEIVMAGKENYGFALGAGRSYKVADSYIDNTAGGTISMLGDKSMAIIAQSDMDHANNAGTINIAGSESYGMYTESATSMTNTGDINITDYSKNFTSNNAGGKWLDNKEYSASNAQKSIGIASGKAGSTITNSGNINISTGENNIGAYTNIGNIVNNGNINVTNGQNIGMYVAGTGTGTNTNAGKVTVNSDGSIGLMTTGTGILTNNGELKVTGGNNATNTIGTIGMTAGVGSTIDSTNGKATIDVTGDKSIGLYSEGTLKIGESTIKTNNGAINYFAKDNGKIEVVTGKTSTATTGQSSLLFYTKGTGKIILNGNINATIKGGSTPSTRGTAFYYEATPGAYGTFNTAAIQNYFNTSFGNGSSTLNNLTLNMEDHSRLFIASNVEMNLSDTAATSLMSGVTNAPTITGSNYKTFMLYLSKLNINQSVDLNDPNNAYNKLEISNSTIENANSMTGSLNRQVAIAQENGNDTAGNGYDANKITLTNTASGVINLTGDESTGIYAKRGIITNDGQISVGKKSTGIYIVEDDRSPATATLGAKATNSSTGVITIGEDSTGMYYKVEPDNADGKGTNTTVSGGLTNTGRIESTADNVIAMSFDSPYTSKTIENTATGVIDLQGQNSTGMFATGAGTYTAKNDGTINLASSTNVNTPNIGMYTDKSTITLENNRTIEGGDKTVGIYGHNVNLGASSLTKVGAGGTGVYSQGGNITINGGTISAGENGTTGSNDAVGVYYVGAGGTITSNATDVKIGNSAYGFVVQNENGAAVTLTTNTPNVTLGEDAVYAYSNNKAGSITNGTTLTSTGDGNYGIYGAGTVTNNGQMNFGTGIGNVGIYSILGGTATNNSTITIGASDSASEKYGIGMAAGYQSSDSGNIINGPAGVINVTGKDSIGMYATGPLSTATNKGTINLSGENSVGMYLDNGATGVNDGSITTIGAPKGVKGVVLSNNSKLINNAGATININSADGFAVYRSNTPKTNVTIVNYGDITVSGGAQADGEYDATGGKELEKTVGGVTLKSPKGTNDINITANGNPVTNVEKVTEPVGTRGDALISNLGMYVDTLRGTNPINGLGYLNIEEADLLYGVEAAENSTSKYFEVSGNILKPYQDAMRTAPQGIKWSHNSAALTWMALPTLDANGIPSKVAMAKIPYTAFAGNEASPVAVTDTYNFLDGLEQRYGVEALGTRENKVFQKLNSIGNNEETLFYQAVDEMMGHQYANTQQRIQATGDILDKEFNYLRSEWQTVSKDSNKVKVFGAKGEYNSDTAGIINYKNNAYGVAYVHEDETVKLGDTIGWYAGIVHNTFKFKDIGNSKEEQLQGKIGIFKSIPFDENNSLNWTISGDIFAGYNKMNRKFLVVDEVFGAKGRYHTYGLGVKNEISKDFRLSESFSLRPYAALGLEYGRVSKIKEKSGEIKLDVKSNDYFSIKPEIGADLIFKQYFGRKTLKVGVTVAYENELGKVANGKNKAKVSNTSADWFNIRGEKEDRRGNVKTDFNIGIDNQRIGLTGNVGYDTKGHNVRGGVGLRVIF